MATAIRAPPCASRACFVSYCRIWMTRTRTRLMIKFMVLFRQPENAERFENIYQDLLALVERIPDIRRRQVVHVYRQPGRRTRVLTAFWRSTSTRRKLWKRRCCPKPDKKRAPNFIAFPRTPSSGCTPMYTKKKAAARQLQQLLKRRRHLPLNQRKKRKRKQLRPQAPTESSVLTPAINSFLPPWAGCRSLRQGTPRSPSV